MPRKDALNLDAVRQRLADLGGRRFWRSLEELAETDEFQQYVQREFPENASEWSDKTSRRRFLQLMGASLALAGVSGCAKQPEEKIIPHVYQPEHMIPGKPLFYASAMTMGGFAKGILVESHMGRPTKVEGNSLHPASLGATDVFAQASILTLYDPDRSQMVLNAGQIGTWNSFLTDLRPRLTQLENKQGAGLRILTETITSPTFAAQIESLLERFPQAKWHQYEPLNRDNERKGLKAAFGQPLNPIFDFTRADVVLALDADFLTQGAGSIRYARDFMTRRFAKLDSTPAEMNRLYVVESTPTSTGAKADHRWALSPTQIETFALALAGRLGLDVPAADATSLPIPPHAIEELASDLRNYRLARDPGGAVVVAGAQQPPLVHALVHAINSSLGIVGPATENGRYTARYTDPIEVQRTEQADSLHELVDDMQRGAVDSLIMIDANPVYGTPPELQFVAALAKTKYRVHLGLYHDETARLCDWHVPESHFLESWSDARAFDGTTTIVQPLIRPLYNGKSKYELLAALEGQANATDHDLVKQFWRQRQNDLGNGFDDWWDECLHDGVVPESAAETRDVSLYEDFASEFAVADRSSGIQLCLRPDPTVWDGRFANNGWLQECPKPITKLTWDNAALVSPKMAEEKSLANGDMIDISHGTQDVRLPVWVTPGQPDNTIAVHLGYGRARTGRVGAGTGFDAFKIQPAASTFHVADMAVKATGETYELACTQHHHAMEGRHLVRSGRLEQFNADPKHPKFMTEGQHGPHEPLSFYEDYEYNGYKWGMAINLGGCIGCNACVVACQAENNIPIVGKDQVAMGREMQWIRVDHYYEGDPDDPSMHFQPVNCMHCEKAPCEVVCPVAATTHSDEGLNEMTYNRCVGTRYCSNNCPYKVRRFNFFHYTKPVAEHDTLKMLQNPDVTVRARGVMEKCTYCVQRISHARIEAEVDGRSIKDGDVVTACQAACPTQAIVFGDLNDPNSAVTQAKNQPLNYVLLEEINTRPRTSYSASVFNPNPKLQPAEKNGRAH